MAQNFEKVPTTEIEIDPQEETVEIPTTIKTKSKKRIRFCVIIGVLLLILGLIFTVILVTQTDNATDSLVTPNKEYAQCESLHCCQFKNESFVDNELGINCNPLQITQCTLNDDICVWDCDTFKPIHRIRSYQNYKFIKFDAGKGKIADLEVGNEPDLPTGNVEPQTVDDMISSSIIYQYSHQCGDVYKIDLDPIIAELRLNNYRMNMSTGSNDYGEHIDMDDGEEDRRRLTVFPPDGRTQSSSKNTFRQRFGLIKSDLGACSGQLISRRVVLTAAHCVYNTETNEWISNLKFYPDAISTSDVSADASYLSVWYSAVSGAWIDTAPISNGVYDVTDSQHDWGIMRLYTADSGRSWLRIGTTNGYTGSRSWNTYGYPGGVGTRWHQFCSYEMTDPGYVRSDTCDIEPGQSGAGIYAYGGGGSRIVHAITSIEGAAHNYYCRIESVDFNAICDWVSNGEETLDGC